MASIYAVYLKGRNKKLTDFIECGKCSYDEYNIQHGVMHVLANNEDEAIGKALRFLSSEEEWDLVYEIDWPQVDAYELSGRELIADFCSTHDPKYSTLEVIVKSIAETAEEEKK